MTIYFRHFCEIPWPWDRRHESDISIEEVPILKIRGNVDNMTIFMENKMIFIHSICEI